MVLFFSLCKRVTSYLHYLITIKNFLDVFRWKPCIAYKEVDCLQKRKEMLEHFGAFTFILLIQFMAIIWFRSGLSCSLATFSKHFLMFKLLHPDRYTFRIHKMKNVCTNIDEELWSLRRMSVQFESIRVWYEIIAGKKCLHWIEILKQIQFKISHGNSSWSIKCSLRRDE